MTRPKTELPGGGQSQRRYPRLPVHIAAVLEFLPTSTHDEISRLPAIVTTLSCGGVGLLPSPTRGAYGGRGRPIGLHLMLDKQEACIRGKVAWRGQDPFGRTVFGIEILLALCPKEVRWAYSKWIVEVLRSNGTRGLG